MRSTKLLTSFLIFIVSMSALTVTAESRLFDQFSNLSCKDEMARLDYLVTVAKDFPDHIIYIFVYAGQDNRRGIAEARLTRIKNYLVDRRGLDINRIRLETVGYREDFTVEVWLIPPSATPPTPTPTVDPKDVKFKRGKIKESDLRCAGK